MSLEDLPQDIRFRVEYFDTAGDHWQDVSASMDTTYSTLAYGARIPDFSVRIPQNLRSFGVAANTAFDAYIDVLDKGATCAAAVGATMHASGLDYLRAEGYNEDLIQAIEQELDA